MFETAPASSSPLPPPDPGADPNAIAPNSNSAEAAFVDATAPADLVPQPSVRERLAWYAGAIIFTCILLFFGLRLDRVTLKAPFYYDLDALLILPMVKVTAERGPGGHWRNDRMGAGVTADRPPQIMELHDFPVIDLLHFTLIWFLSLFIKHVVVLFNAYFLLTFPLTTLTAMIVFRHLGLTLPAAVVGGLLYSFLPFHYQRWENHYFLAAYWLVPLSLLPVFAICCRRFPFFRRNSDGSLERELLSARSIGIVVLGIAVGSAGAYYAFFTCALTAFAGLYAWAVHRTWRALAAAGGFIAVIAVIGIIHHLPTFLYQWEHARNPITDRMPEEADSYGMKIAHLVLPIPDHNLSILANLRVRYLVPNRPAEGENAGSLGIVGTTGFVGLLLMLLLPYRRGWPYGPLAALTLFALLLATIGGFGAVFNLIVTSQIRAYNRISVFIAFFCLLAVLWTFDRFLVTRRWRVPLGYVVYPLIPPLWFLLVAITKIVPARRERIDRFRRFMSTRTVSGTTLVWAGVFLVGFLDQTPYAWFKSGITKTIHSHAGRFLADENFFAEMEASMPPGSKVFCLPYAPFPEHSPVAKMPVYEHARGYIHTEDDDLELRRDEESRGRRLATQRRRARHDGAVRQAPRAVVESVDRIVCAGFDGLLIDTRGFTLTKEGDRARAIMKIVTDRYEDLVRARTKRPIQDAERLNVIPHLDGRQFFVDLRLYRDELRRALPGYYEELTRNEQDWVALLWLDGFDSPEDPMLPRHDPLRARRASAWFVNPSNRERKFGLWMTFGTDTPGPVPDAPLRTDQRRVRARPAADRLERPHAHPPRRDPLLRGHGPPRPPCDPLPLHPTLALRPRRQPPLLLLHHVLPSRGNPLIRVGSSGVVTLRCAVVEPPDHQQPLEHRVADAVL